MPFYTGKTAKLKLGENEIAKVKNWSLDVSADMLETAALGDSIKGFTPGISSITGSADLHYYTGATTGVVQLLQNIITSGVSESNRVELTFEVGTDQSFKGNAYINSANISVATSEVTSASFQFTIDGPLTETITSGTV